MIGACQQNSGIFLVRGGGAERDADGDRGWDRARCRRPNHRGWDWQRNLQEPGRRQPNHRGWRRARSDMPAGAEAGLAAGSERDAGGAEAGDAEAGLAAEPPRIG